MTEHCYRAVKQTQSVLIHFQTLNCFLWKCSFFPMIKPFVVSYGIRSHCCWWSNVLIRKPGAARIISFPALSHICSLQLEGKKKKEYGDGELTWLSDSLRCWRIIFLQLTAFWLCDIFTKSDLVTDLNAKWTLRIWTTFHLCVPSSL